MVDATSASPPGRELAATASLAMPQPQRAAIATPLLAVTVLASPPEAAGTTEQPANAGCADDPAAAQTRQIAHRTRAGVASTI